MPAGDRLHYRRRAAALARHYRDAEGLSIWEISRRLGRAEATVKAYLYDPSDANKGPSWEREAEPGGRELRSHPPAAASRGDVLPRRTLFCARLAVQHAGRLGVLMLDLSRNGAARRNSRAITATRRGCRSRRSLVGWDAQKQPSRRISTIQSAIRHARSRRATGECVAAAVRPPRHGTARATPTRIADAAIPARSRGRTRERVREAMRAWRARYGAAPSSYDWSRTHARRRGAEARKRLQAGNGPRRPLSSICTRAGRRPSRTPSAAPERSGVNAVDIRTRAGA